jgi:shikimate dehydrogenase
MRKTTVNATSELYTIFGTPISHAMSPVIMNSFFDRLDMDKVFLAMDTGLDTFDHVMATTRLVDFKGYVFTMPVKERALRFMDSLSEEAAIIGAVNCAKNDNGHLTGSNTDSIGFWNAVQAKNTGGPIIRAFVMGAGGFARAAVAQLAIRGVNDIVVSNMLSDTAFVDSFFHFRDRLQAKCPAANVSLIDWSPELWKQSLPGCRVVANATPNGMKDVGDLHDIFPYGDVQKDAVFFDAIYEPRFTKFLHKAEALGFTTVEGLDLLVHQGACSFHTWTGVRVDPAQMLEDILQFMNTRRK